MEKRKTEKDQSLPQRHRETQRKAVNTDRRRIRLDRILAERNGRNRSTTLKTKHRAFIAEGTEKYDDLTADK